MKCGVLSITSCVLISSVPDRSTLSYEEVFSVYSKLCEIDVMFRDIEQIKIFKKELNEGENNSIKV